MDMFDAILFIVIGSIIFAVVIFPLFLMSIFAVSVLFPYIIGAVGLYLLWKIVKKRA
jgi:hypothetical protein